MHDDYILLINFDSCELSKVDTVILFYENVFRLFFSMVGIGSLVLRHSARHFPKISEDIAY